MFGWEFPPHIAGGLGTACYGMTRGLARNGVEVVFVMPRAYGDEDQRFVRVVNASDVETIGTRDHEFSEELLEKVSFIHIDSNMLPYISPEEYAAYHDEFVRSGRTHEWTDVWKQRYTFSGKYGANLMEEVARYAMVAAQVAKDLEGQFDVIHAHDWLTYFAGIAAKRVSGKPLVVHMHATEFDRSGENINRRVYAIEKAGMQAADRVIAVSELTRRIVIGKYGILADKVVTVHNAVRFGESEEAAPERAVKDKVVTFLGRITYQKGPDYFVEAAAKVLQRVSDVRFVMAGSGDLMNHVVRRVAQLGIADRFHFTGFLKGGEVQRMFRLSDVYVMPSVSEPFGISPLEAILSTGDKDRGHRQTQAPHHRPRVGARCRPSRRALPPVGGSHLRGRRLSVRPPHPRFGGLRGLHLPAPVLRDFRRRPAAHRFPDAHPYQEARPQLVRRPR